MMISFENKVALITGGIDSPPQPVLRIPHGSRELHRSPAVARGGGVGPIRGDLTARCGLNRSSLRADGEIVTSKLQEVLKESMHMHMRVHA